ncbi:MAG: PAS domain-containing protein [Sphingomonadaceae bacterium]
MEKILAEWQRPSLTRDDLASEYIAESRALTEQLDRFASLAARLCDAPVGFVSLVEADRQCFVGRYGSTFEETPRDQSFCAHAMLLDRCMVVPDARDDPRFASNPLVTDDPEIRFYAGYPLKTPDGVPLGSFCVIDFVPRAGLSSGQLADLETLAHAAMAIMEQAHGANRRVVLDRLARNRIEELKQQFDVLADALPPLVWSTDSEGQADYFNQRWIDYTGLSPEASYGAKWLERLHPDDVPHTQEVWLEAVASSTPYQAEYRVRAADGTYRWFLARGLPIKGPDGAVQRWIGTCTDIEEQKDSQQQLHLLSRELNHRIKNIFAVIGGLISITRRNRPEIAEAATELQDRILALGRAHDFVRSGTAGLVSRDRGSTMHGMLRALLSPYQDSAGERICITGDDPAIDDRSATALALYFHELATNAAKYGALSVPEGRVEISITDGDPATLVWSETGGPPVTPSVRQGFGASLVDLSIARQLGGEVEYEWREAGVIVAARIPAASLSR